GDQFEIEAPAHTYAASGIYPLTVTVDDTDPASGIGRNIAFVQPVVTVSPLAISTAPVTATEGLALPNAQTIDLSTGPAATLVATFTDSAGLDAASDYSVVIDWGNGQTTSGTILPDGPDFAIIAPATPSIIYAEEGHYTIQIAVTDHVDGFTAFAATSATVDDAALAPSAPQPTIPTVTQGIPTGQIPIASFHDANPSAPVSDFTATIDWGDGSPQSAGIVSQPGGIGTAFLVSGNHLYIHPSTGAGDTVTVHIVDDGGATLNVLITVPVVASTIVGTPATFNAVEGLPVSNVIVATFTDSGLAGPLSSYQATIGWNDGTPGTTTIGQVVPLGGNDFEVIGNLPTGYPEEGNFTVTVTLSHNGSTVDVIGNSIAKVADAPLSTAGPAIAVAATEGVAIPAGTTVAIFTDADPAGTTSDYTATINWGDGTPTETLPPSAITQPGGPGSAFIVQAGGHIYVEEGLDSFTVTITDHNASTTVAGQATVADSPPIASPTQPAVNTTEGQVFSGPAASFTELYTNGIQTNPEAASDYTATIDWGDGSPNSVGIVVATATPGFYQVLGTHVYAQSGVNIGGNPSVPVGTFPITVTVHDDGGTNVVIPNLAHVSDVPIVVTGQLNPSSDTGKFNNDGITDDSTPNFFGTSEAGSSVSLFATPVGGGTSILIGQAVADANGNWSVTSIHLADGSYTIAATAIDSAHQTTTASTVPIAVVSNGGANVLTIDTVGPRVTDVSFNRATGTVSLTFADDRSGLLLQSLIDSANYAFNRQLARPLGTFIITTINLTPGPNANEETATLSIASTSKGQTLSSALLRGFFLITARSKSVLNPSAIQDVAGNALDGEYYGPASASGNGIPGGDFVANLNNYHNITNPPATVIGFPHPNDPAGHFGKQQRTKPVPKPVVKHVPTHVPKSVPKVHKHR
ncbi:MAG: Ig-like domain-containing protein, partial [Isosphaeraceae bacterium]|nr:Ig-like domain-containing protein [Isosphaeraceae bacterium]